MLERFGLHVWFLGGKGCTERLTEYEVVTYTYVGERVSSLGATERIATHCGLPANSRRREHSIGTASPPNGNKAVTEVCPRKGWGRQDVSHGSHAIKSRECIERTSDLQAWARSVEDNLGILVYTRLALLMSTSDLWSCNRKHWKRI